MWRRLDWSVVPEAAKGAVFLLSLVACASLMPVDKLPARLLAGDVGPRLRVCRLYPLTALALKQGGYDWGMLSYCVGFGGSMIWFGSSAGVAVSNLFPEARSVGRWLAQGWYVALAYVVGFAAMLFLVGWRP